MTTVASEGKYKHPHWDEQDNQKFTKELAKEFPPLSLSPSGPPRRARSPRSQREWQREVCGNLRGLHQPTWGYTIFRTVYSPESDVQFPLFLSKLDKYAKHAIDADLSPMPYSRPSNDPPFDSGPNEEMFARFVNDVVEDRELDGVGVDEVREAFKKWLEGAERANNARDRVCIMVDQAVLDSVAAAPEDPEHCMEFRRVWVKVVEYEEPYIPEPHERDEDYEEGREEEPEWQGWLKVALLYVYGFWFDVSAYISVQGLFETMEEDGDESCWG